MGLKDLIVTLDPTERGFERLRVALQLARRDGADLTGCYVAATTGHLEHAGGSAAEVAESMEGRFEEELAATSVKGRWVLSGTPALDDLVLRSRVVDLVVAGLGDPADATADPQGFGLDELVLACGRPVLGLPIANVPGAIGRNVLIAWNGSREASRALHDALPLLAHAEAVTLLVVDRDGIAEMAIDHLRRHEVKVAPDVVVHAGMEITDVILMEVERLGIDLLVAGAYGHSRVSEFLFGGVSRALLHQMAVPVLVSH